MASAALADPWSSRPLLRAARRVAAATPEDRAETSAALVAYAERTTPAVPEEPALVWGAAFIMQPDGDPDRPGPLRMTTTAFASAVALISNAKLARRLNFLFKAIMSHLEGFDALISMELIQRQLQHEDDRSALRAHWGRTDAYGDQGVWFVQGELGGQPFAGLVEGALSALHRTFPEEEARAAGRKAGVFFAGAGVPLQIQRLPGGLRPRRDRSVWG